MMGALEPLIYLVLDMSFQSCIYIGVIFCDEVGENAFVSDSRCTCLGSLICATTINIIMFVVMLLKRPRHLQCLHLIEKSL
jgi:hypothetical protein